MRRPPRTLSPSAAPSLRPAQAPRAPHVTRRGALQQLSVALAACATVTSVPSLPSAASAAAPPPSPNWLPMAQFSRASAESMFPEPFVAYLARFLVTYDAPTASWYRNKLAVLPASWSDARRRTAIADTLGEFSASLTYRLAPMAAAGSVGAASLWDTLQAAYGADAASGARSQLPLLFSLLRPAEQPIDAMGAALLQLDGGGGSGSRGSEARRSEHDGTGSSTALTPMSASTATELADALGARADVLLPSSVRPQWDPESGAYGLPAELRRALSSEDAARQLGSIGRAPLSSERPLSASEYSARAPMPRLEPRPQPCQPHQPRSTPRGHASRAAPARPRW